MDRYGGRMHFMSNREQRLWLQALAVLLAIWSTIPLAGTLAGILRERNLLSAVYVAAFALVVTAIVGRALARSSGQRESWAALGITAVYALLVVRMGVTPEERTHLFEYGLLAVLIRAALSEGRRYGRRVPAPPVVAVVLTALLGWVDEGIQAILPGRVYDLRDVGTNALAGLVAVIASWVLARARWGDRSKRRSR